MTDSAQSFTKLKQDSRSGASKSSKNIPPTPLVIPRCLILKKKKEFLKKCLLDKIA